MKRTRHVALVVRCLATAVAGCFDAIVGAIQSYEDAFDAPPVVVGDEYDAAQEYGAVGPLRPSQHGDELGFDDHPPS